MAANRALVVFFPRPVGDEQGTEPRSTAVDETRKVLGSGRRAPRRLTDPYSVCALYYQLLFRFRSLTDQVFDEDGKARLNLIERFARYCEIPARDLQEDLGLGDDGFSRRRPLRPEKMAAAYTRGTFGISGKRLSNILSDLSKSSKSDVPTK